MHARPEALDLNLLVALETLLAVGNVTRAAARLGITQSAMSHRLRRLRELLGDPVLVASKHGWVATPRAERLCRVVSRSLHDVRAALATAERFDPATSDRTFTVVSSDYAEFEVLPRVLEELSRRAPRVTTVLREPSATMLDDLERGAADLVVGPQFAATPGLVQRKVAEDGFAAAVRRDHPVVGERLDLDTFVAVRHLVVEPGGRNATSIVDEALTKLGRRRDVAMRIPHFLGGPFIVARSDLLLVAPAALLRHFARLLPLRVFEPPLALPIGRVFMTWHQRVNDDPAHAWVRDLTARCTAEAVASLSPRRRPGTALDLDARADVSAPAGRRPRRRRP